MKAFLPILLLCLVAAGCRSARPQIARAIVPPPAAAPLQFQVTHPTEGHEPSVFLMCTAPTNGYATQAVWEVTQDFRTWKPVLTNQSAWHTGLPGTCGFWRVRWQMK